MEIENVDGNAKEYFMSLFSESRRREMQAAQRNNGHWRRMI